MSYTKRYIEDLVEQGKLCPACFNPDHDFQKCMEEKDFIENLQAEQNLEIEDYLNR